MTLTFCIRYHTLWGESIGLVFEGEEQIHAMHYTEVDCWQVEINCHDKKSLQYRYVVCRDGVRIREEWTGHSLCVSSLVEHCRIYDGWNDIPAGNAFFSSVFTKSIYARHCGWCEPLAADRGKILIQVKAAAIQPNETLAVVGSCPALGEWNVSRALRLDDCTYPVWMVSIDAEEAGEAFEYKFVILDTSTGALKMWEGGNNRRYVAEKGAEGDAIVLSGLQMCESTRLWKGAGVAVPLFSLRSEKSFGVGDFADLRLLVDWAVATRQRMIQVLPVNDTTMTGTWSDSYPYSAKSIYALHPQYLRVEEVGEIKDPSRRAYFEQQKRELNALAEIDYERVNKVKGEYIAELFEQQGEEDLASDDFIEFYAANKQWLLPYAAYRTLCAEYHTPDFHCWGEYASYDAAAVALFEMPENHYCHTMRLHYFTQYHLSKQMKEARAYANKRGVVLKGDVPIGISPRSADAWATPSYFRLDSQAGAPPDDFSVLGQNWFLPTYNWDEIAKDGYRWWKSRFRKMAEYFDAYRIDHILGFFRIWEIPCSALHGLLGHFNPALPFSVEELSARGFNFDADLYTHPYVRDYMLGEIFGEYTDDVRRKYLSSLGNGCYGLRPEVGTQQKVAALFAGKDDERSKTVRDGLMQLLDEVLFIEDPIKRGYYHPRISASQSYIYRSLPDYQRYAFDALYTDFYYYRHNDFWYGEAMKKLPPLLSATDMLVCGEDLGMIPHCVPTVMKQLQILSLEVQRMPKTQNSLFGDTWHYPYLSVATTSTHDMSGIRGWWEEDRAHMQEFYNHVLGFDGPMPYFCEPYVCERIIDQHLESPSMLVVLPLQDWLSMDGTLRRENPQEERINVPAINPYYWRYRMHLTIEQLLAATAFNDKIREKITRTGR